ncbi:MAG: glycosyltransferase family 4 protein [Deltaproteobacteria bacterium]|jgi:glycosyltransferase involved in cell wall biosynthesis|nr:glycosyltransferase family 4 protein [Deltaproteobacteria bacterium]
MNTEKAFVVPRTAYVQLWFPSASETFVFREVCALRDKGLPIYIYTLYGLNTRGCSERMRSYNGPLTRFGLRALWRVLSAFCRELFHRPGRTFALMRCCLLRRMRDLETLGENSWCFFAGFAVAEAARRDGIELLHAPWANGSSTAVWVASRLTGIPFAFTGRAGDMYPPDGLLREKLEACLFARTNTAANVRHMAVHAPAGHEDKIVLAYNILTLPNALPSRASVPPPHNILAVGRFVRTKGFAHLLTAMARLQRESFPCRLTLVGSGRLRASLRSLRARLRLEDCVSMPGFVSHDGIAALLQSCHMLVAPCVVTETGDRDGIPNVIIEALSQGVPVVATNVSGIGEVVVHNKTGLLVEQRNPRELADAIRTLAADRERALEMAEEGRRLVRRMFDPQTNIQALYDLYVERFNAVLRQAR